MSRYLFILFIFLLTPFVLPAQINGVSMEDNASLQHEIVLTKNWKYALGDSLNRKEINYDDSKWETVKYYEGYGGIVALPNNKFKGCAWFRYKLKTDSAMNRATYVISLSHNGAAELYIDGKLLCNYGTPSSDSSKENISETVTQGSPVFSFGKGSEHTIAVRYSYWKMYLKYHDASFINSQIYGFRLSLKEWKQYQDDTIKNTSKISGIYGWLSGFFYALCVLHLFLFLYFRQNKSNLYYSLYSFAIAGVFLLKLIEQNHDSKSFDILLDLCYFVLQVALIRFLYSLFYSRPLKLIWLIPILYVIYYVIHFTIDPIFPISYFFFAFIFFLIAVESIRVLVQAMWRKKEGAKIIGAGVVVPVAMPLILFAVVVLTSDTASNGVTLTGFTKDIVVGLLCFATMSISISMSVFLARQFGTANKKLKEQLVEIKDLSEKTIEQEKEKKKILEAQNIELEEKVKERTSEVVHQKEVVEIKNREILDSIEYALRIQTAILPPQRIIKQYLQNSFILYKPKDIVAGDFYWMETVQLADESISLLANETNRHTTSTSNQLISASANQLILFAACDCTGHGVPGAMVSVVCHNALNRAVREFGLTKPSEILDKTAEIVIENFASSEEDIKDGMDISLCSLNLQTLELQWAGANNPLWIVRNTELTNFELLETKADKQPIGMNDDHHPFTNHTFTLNSGDSVYLFTDGFADQFGGETGDKKLTRKHFKELILSVQHLPMPQQGEALEKFIADYRKEIEQIDDILVMGVKI